MARRLTKNYSAGFRWRFFAASEIGPVAGRNALHGFTPSMPLFIDDTK